MRVRMMPEDGLNLVVAVQLAFEQRRLAFLEELIADLKGRTKANDEGLRRLDRDRQATADRIARFEAAFGSASLSHGAAEGARIDAAEGRRDSDLEFQDPRPCQVDSGARMYQRNPSDG